MAKIRLGANYVRLWSAATVSNLGDGVTLAALPLLAASLTRSPTSIAAVSLAGTLPWLFFALIGGALADRVDRKRTMAIVDTFRMVAMGTLAVLVLTDNATLWVIAAIAFALGTSETLFDNASQAILPNIVDVEGLELANGRLQAAEVVTNQFVGPPFGALLFAAAAAAPFFLDAASFGLAAIAILGLRGSFRPAREFAADVKRPTIRADIAEGLRWLRGHHLLRNIAIVLALLNLFDAGVFAITVLFALEVLGLSQAGYGLLLTAGGIGAFAGSLFARRLTSALGPGTTCIVAVFGLGTATLVPGLWANPIVTGISLGFLGAFAVAWNVVTVSLRQAIIPDAILGRVNSAYRLVGWGTMPIGALLGGVLAKNFGLRAPFIIGGIAQLIVAVVIIPFINNRTIAEARRTAGAE